MTDYISPLHPAIVETGLPCGPVYVYTNSETNRLQLIGYGLTVDNLEDVLPLVTRIWNTPTDTEAEYRSSREQAKYDYACGYMD